MKNSLGILILAILTIAGCLPLPAQSPTPTPTPVPLATPTPPPTPAFLNCTSNIPSAMVTGLLNGTITLPQAISLPSGVTTSMVRESYIHVLPNGSANVTVTYINPAFTTSATRR